MAGYKIDIEVLPRVELDTWKENECSSCGVLGNDGEDVFVRQVG